MGLTISRTGGDYAYTENGGTKGKLGSKMQIGWNLEWSKAWTPQVPFLNLFRRNSGDWTDGGSSADYFYWTTATTWFPDTSNIVVEWAGSGTLTMLNMGSPVSSAANRVVYNPANISNTNVGLRIASGTPDANSVTIFQEEYESNIDAGDVVNPQFITDVSGASYLRFMNPMDTNEANSVTFAEYQQTNGYPREDLRMSMRGIAEICNACNITPWITPSVMLNSSALTSMATELNTYLDSGLSVAVEPDNETWNGAFGNQYYFTLYRDLTLHNGGITFDPVTATATETSHGLATGDSIRCYNTPTQSRWPFADGGRRSVIVDDANTFRAANTLEAATRVTDAQDESDYDNAGDNGTFTGGTGHTVSDVITITGGTTVTVDAVSSGAVTEFTINNNADSSGGHDVTDTLSQTGTTGSGTGFSLTIGLNNLGNDCLVTTDPDYNLALTPHSEVTDLRYHEEGDYTGTTRDANYAQACIDMWDAFDTVFGAGRVVHIVGAHAANAVTTTNRLTPAVKARYDYVAIAPYFNFGTMPDFGTSTNAEITDWLIANDFITNNGSDVRTQVEAQIAAVGSANRIICYEGGDHTTTASKDAAEITKFNSWTLSSEHGRAVRAYMNLLAELGIKHYVHYRYTGAHDTSGGGRWGALLNTGSGGYPYSEINSVITEGGAHG